MLCGQLALELGFDSETRAFYDIDELLDGLEAAGDLPLDALDDGDDFD